MFLNTSIFGLKILEMELDNIVFGLQMQLLHLTNIHRNDSILSNQLEPLIKNYNQWEKLEEIKKKYLYFQWDLADGMEVTASGRI